MDKIFLRGMKADTLIGVYDWERERPQTLILDLDIGIPEQSGQDDHIGNTVHYGEVCEAVRASLAEQGLKQPKRFRETRFAPFQTSLFMTQEVV